MTINEIVMMTDGLSCADIETVVNEAIIHSVSARREKILTNDFSYAVGRVSMRDIPKKLEGSTEMKKSVAYHEAGHAYMLYRLCPDQLGTISIASQGNSLGRVSQTGNDDLKEFSQKQDEEKIMVCLAGFLSAKIMTGQNCLGASNDIKNAMNIIEEMMNDGIYGFEYCSFENPRFYMPISCDKQLEAIYVKKCEILNELKERTEAILKEGISKIEALATRLVEMNELSSMEIRRIFDAN